MKFLMDLHVLRFHDSENYNFIGQSVCVYVSFFGNINKKQTTEKTLNFKFYISVLCRCFLNLLMKTGKIVCLGKQRNLNTLWFMGINFCQCISIYLGSLNIVKLTYIFDVARYIFLQNMQLTVYGMNCILITPIIPYKIIWMYYRGSEIYIPIFLYNFFLCKDLQIKLDSLCFLQ